MNNMIDLIKEENFKFVVMPGSDPDPKYMDYYNSAYECWLQVWSEAYQELGVAKHLFADDFTRQTEINCIFYGSKCVGILFLKWADISIPAQRNDSYFKLWTDKELDGLARDGSKILVCSNTTISAEWRRNVGNISMKDLIVYFSTQRFIHSEAAAMTAVTRKTRGIHKLTERFGATVLKADVPNFNDADLVDLCAFYRDTVTEGTDEIVMKLGRKLWNNMLVVPKVFTELSTIKAPVKKVA